MRFRGARSGLERHCRAVANTGGDGGGGKERNGELGPKPERRRGAQRKEEKSARVCARAWGWGRGERAAPGRCQEASSAEGAAARSDGLLLGVKTINTPVLQSAQPPSLGSAGDESESQKHITERK